METDFPSNVRVIPAGYESSDEEWLSWDTDDDGTYGVPFYYLFPIYGNAKIDFWISIITFLDFQ